MAKSSTPRHRWTPEDLDEHYRRQGKAVPEHTRQVLEQLGLIGRLRTPPPPAAGQEAPARPRRRGVSVAPILASLRSSLVFARAQEGPVLSLWFDGARLLTANELISIYQYRKHDTYAYKKAWKRLVGNALQALPRNQPVPHFDGPTRLWLYRRGKRLVDLDALPVMFKYAIDALRSHGVISDDNPEVIVEPRLLQEKGSPSLAMRLERLPDWRGTDLSTLKRDWVGDPPQA